MLVAPHARTSIRELKTVTPPAPRADPADSSVGAPRVAPRHQYRGCAFPQNDSVCME
jgi:hypothetical protein